MCYDKPRRCSLATFSLIIFSLRTVVENGTHLLTYFVDHDSSLKSLISCLDLFGADNTNHRSSRSPTESSSPISLRCRHRPFLHLTRVETLDDDFFSGDDDDARSLFGPNQISPILIFSSSPHSTSKLGFNVLQPPPNYLYYMWFYPKMPRGSILTHLPFLSFYPLQPQDLSSSSFSSLSLSSSCEPHPLPTMYLQHLHHYYPIVSPSLSSLRDMDDVGRCVMRFTLFSKVLKTGMARGKLTHFFGEPMSFEGISGHLRSCHDYSRVAISSLHLDLHFGS
ncbi:hypothetical protein FF2_010096 [Malus domestica]